MKTYLVRRLLRLLQLHELALDCDHLLLIYLDQGLGDVPEQWLPKLESFLYLIEQLCAGL